MADNNDKVQDDLMAELLGTLGTGDSDTEETEEDDTTTEEGTDENEETTTDENDDEEDDTEDTSTDDDDTEEDDTEEESEDEETNTEEDESASAANVLLQAQFQSLSDKYAVLEAKLAPKDKGTDKEKATFDPAEFLLTEEELDEVLDKPELLNAAMKRMGIAFNKQLEAVQSAVPQAVQQQVDAVTQTKSMVKTFYDKNPDLAEGGRKRFVQFTFQEQLQEAQAAGGQVDFLGLLNKTAKAVRKELGIKTQVVKKTPDGVKPKSKKKPTMPGTQSGRKAQKKTTKRKGQHAMMDDLL